MRSKAQHTYMIGSIGRPSLMDLNSHGYFVLNAPDFLTGYGIQDTLL
jgi:hypothetical protein